MRWRPRPTPLTWAAVVLALAWTGFVVRPHVEGLSSPLDRFEEVCLDLRYQLSPGKPPPSDVVLVAIDDETVRQAGAYPLPRQTLASIVEAVGRFKPKAIALDLLLVTPGLPDADAQLARALGTVPSVIAAAGVFADGSAAGATPRGAGLSLPPQATSLLWPAEPMAGAAEVGLVNVSTGFGGTPRHIPLLIEGPDGVVPSFALLAAALARDRSPKFGSDGLSFGDRPMALDLGQHLAIRFYGPRGTIPTISGQSVQALDTAALAGRIVVIGATAVGSGDTFPTPFSSVVPGAEILATAIDNLMAGDGLVRTQSTRWLDAAAAVALALAAVALIASRRSLLGLALVLSLAATWAIVTLLAFNHGYWLSTTVPLAAMIPVAAVYGSARLWLERRSTSRLAGVEQGLRLFNPRPMSDLISQNPDFLAEPQVQDASVVFVDLSGYTTLSETVDPVRMRDLLKSFHALIDGIVDERGGFVATFMGDGAMILFGFPHPQADDAARALDALSELETRLREWGRSGETGVRHQVQARLAAHHGPVVISRLGGDTHQQITATGDTVNVASRLLEVAKQHGVSAVISEEMFEAAGSAASKGRFSCRVDAPIRGRQQSVAVRLIEGAEL